MAMTAENRPRRPSTERIGRYQVIERIGRGAMGVVYRAHDDLMGRDVALKVLMADLEDDPEVRTRFMREAEAAARLSHPNIITIFDVGEDGDRFFIVMELLSGTTLKDLMKSPDRARLEYKVDLMIQACAGLRAAHNASIYHRDVKPGNLFVRTDGLLKILDFGVARVASSSMTATGFVVGTPDYMSPEQARGDEIDGRSDIFSLGAVFYFMLTGRKPFPATQLPVLFRQIQSDQPAPIADAEAPAEVIPLLMKALAKKPEERYQNCQELMNDLMALRSSFSSEQRESISHLPDMTDDAGEDADEDVAEAAAGAPSTDDTVDALPVSAFSTDDTVTLRAPTLMGRARDVIDSAITGTLTWFRSPDPPVRPRQTGMRKR
jgi:serine/threonine-protein kinase